MRTSFFRPATLHAFFAGFLLSTLAFFLSGLYHISAATENNLRENLFVTIFLRPALTDMDGAAVAKSIQDGDKEVVSTSFVSKEEALQQAERDPVLSKSLMLLKENPLPAFVTVRYSDAAWLQRDNPGEMLTGISQMQEMKWNPLNRAAFRKAHAWRRMAEATSIGLAVVLLFWFIAGVLHFVSSHLRFEHLFSGALAGALGAGSAWLAEVFLIQRFGGEGTGILSAQLSLLPIITGIIIGMTLSGWGGRVEL